MTDFINKHNFELLNASFSLSNQAIYWLNKEGQILYANENALESLGYSLEEILKLNVWDVDANVNTKEKYTEAVKSFEVQGPDGRPNVLQTEHKKKSGETFPVEIVSKFTSIEGEEILISYVKDITIRLKRTEDINFYFDLIDSSRDMIILAEHKTGQIEFANEKTCQNLGFSLAELKNMNVSDFRKPFEDSRNIELPDVFKKIEQTETLTTFGIYITKDKKEIPVETSLRMKSYHGRDFVIAISRDISERIEIEKEKESLNNKLKNYNLNLQLEISKAKEELIEYENMMKKQSRMAAMGEMLENIAHQWRQPLSAVSVLSTGMLLQNEQSLLKENQLNENLNVINDHVQYLSKTIDDFRNFFKPDKQKSYFKIENLIETAIKLAKTRYSSDENIEFILDVAKIDVYNYESELLQVLLNLIANSKDALLEKQREKLIFIEVKECKECVCITIRDNGEGISDRILEKVFEPYFTTKHNSHGTGIGLYMSKNIIGHMGGTIEVENREFEYNNNRYKGASFLIKLPVK